jgi:electron transfer flavoprotein beta subunit
MGPLSAMKVLKEAIAMGCDRAILISDRAFAGADTWSTSYTLAKAIEKIGEVDLIITGERATDGDTGQVGPEIASWLNLPLVTYVSDLGDVTNGSLRLKRLVEEGYQTVEVMLPCLITVLKEVATVRLSTLDGKMRAMEMNIPTWTAEQLEVEHSHLGLKGSPTKVVKIESTKVMRDTQVVKALEADKVEKAVSTLIEFLEEKQLLCEGVQK